jgi:hypothetical protein
MKPIGIFWRTFILINRVFGASCAIAGIGLVLEALGQLLRRRTFDADFWQLLGIGISAILVGMLYAKAPLFRSKHQNETTPH